QDTAGPMARTVTDAAILLGAIAGADPADPATAAAGAIPDYTRSLDADGLRGARLGVVRKYFRLGGQTDAVFDAALDALKRRGALGKCRTNSRAQGIDAVMDSQHLDALIAPAGGPAAAADALYGDRDIGGSSSPAAVAGYPNITVPAGYVSGLPVGLSFFGRAF